VKPDEALLAESAWQRAKRDTWPSGWWKKFGKRALIAAIAVGADFLLRDAADRHGLVQKALVGLAAFALADFVLYPLNALLAPIRQRDELRAWAQEAKEASARPKRKLSIRAAVGHGSGDINLIKVSNTGDETVRDITVNMPTTDGIQSVSWRLGDVVIEELLPGETSSIPFMVHRSLGRSLKSVRVELRGKVGSGGAQKT
jgi:hypothetical protein